jgi:hypothetical protein
VNGGAAWMCTTKHAAKLLLVLWWQWQCMLSQLRPANSRRMIHTYTHIYKSAFLLRGAVTIAENYLQN